MACDIQGTLPEIPQGQVRKVEGGVMSAGELRVGNKAVNSAYFLARRCRGLEDLSFDADDFFFVLFLFAALLVLGLSPAVALAAAPAFGFPLWLEEERFVCFSEEALELLPFRFFAPESSLLRSCVIVELSCRVCLETSAWIISDTTLGSTLGSF